MKCGWFHVLFKSSVIFIPFSLVDGKETNVSLKAYHIWSIIETLDLSMQIAYLVMFANLQMEKNKLLRLGVQLLKVYLSLVLIL